VAASGDGTVGKGVEVLDQWHLRSPDFELQGASRDSQRRRSATIRALTNQGHAGVDLTAEPMLGMRLVRWPMPLGSGVAGANRGRSPMITSRGCPGETVLPQLRPCAGDHHRQAYTTPPMVRCIAIR
jgi:hypothetical protein